MEPGFIVSDNESPAVTVWPTVAVVTKETWPRIGATSVTVSDAFVLTLAAHVGNGPVSGGDRLITAPDLVAKIPAALSPAALSAVLILVAKPSATNSSESVAFTG